MTLPEVLVTHLEHRTGRRLQSATPVSGGCISHTARLEYADQSRAFLKWAHDSDLPAALFSAEAHSLKVLAATHTVRVPSVLDTDAEDGWGWLLLEWLEPGARRATSLRALGGQLAALHACTAAAYGWAADNFIGSLAQSNRAHMQWPAFWREERLQPQLELAAQRLSGGALRRLEALASACDELLGDAASDGPSLLHGDLWSGNLHVLADGTPALIDPSSYYGHREVDLAMTQLFGGFADEFYHAYQEAWPLVPGWERRLLVYQLYYLLVHVNLFGGGYAAQVMSAAAELGF